MWSSARTGRGRGRGAAADGEHTSMAIGAFSRVAEKVAVGTVLAAPASLFAAVELHALIQFAVGHLQLFLELAVLRLKRFDASILGGQQDIFGLVRSLPVLLAL